MWRMPYSIALNLRRLPKLVDSYKVYNSWYLGPVKTQVHFLKPISYEEYQDRNTHQIAALVKSRIQEKLTELGC